MATLITISDGDATPSVADARVAVTNNSGATTITAIDDGVNGQLITFIFKDNNTKVQPGAALILSEDDQDSEFQDGDTLSLVYYNAIWYESGRSVNS